MSVQSKIDLWKGVKHKKWIDNLFSNYAIFILESNKSETTKEWEIKNISHFLTYIEAINTNIITIRNVYNYFEIQKTKYSLRTIYNRKQCIRFFLDWLYNNNKINFNGKMIFPKIVKPTGANLISYYNNKEITKILNSIDVKTTLGKRNYAIISLFAYLGMRRDDVRTLKFENIDWDNNLLKYYQNKTKNLLVLPMPKIVKLSLLDYVKNARPNIDNEYVFIKNNGDLYYIEYFSVLTNRIIEESGVNIKDRKYGTHIFRHSIATNMLKEHIPITIISQTLGHSKTNTTSNEYIAYDKNILKKISLEVPLWK